MGGRGQNLMKTDLKTCFFLWSKYIHEPRKVLLITKNARASGGFAPCSPAKGSALGSQWGPMPAPKPPAAWAVADATALFSPYRLCQFGGLI